MSSSCSVMLVLCLISWCIQCSLHRRHENMSARGAYPCGFALLKQLPAMSCVGVLHSGTQTEELVMNVGNAACKSHACTALSTIATYHPKQAATKCGQLQGPIFQRSSARPVKLHTTCQHRFSECCLQSPLLPVQQVPNGCMPYIPVHAYPMLHVTRVPGPCKIFQSHPGMHT